MLKGMRRRARHGLGLIAWAALSAGAGAAGPVSDWVSTDAVIYVEAPRPAVLLDRATDPRVLALFDAVPGLRQALERDDSKKLKDVATLVADRLEKPWDVALRELTGGGAVLAVEASRGKPPGVVLIVTPTDPALLQRAVEVVLDLASDDAADRGGEPVAVGEHRGITGYGPPGTKAVYAVVEGRLVIADRSETLKGLIDRALDGLPADRRVDALDAWKARKGATTDGTLAWGLARMDLLRELDPKKFGMAERPDAGQTLLFGGWIETLKKAPWVAASLTWTDAKLGGEVAMPAPPDGKASAFGGFFPPKGEGAPALLSPPGVVLSASLWRDMAAVWESKGDVFRPEDAQGLAQLDTFAGQFFGGTDFGSAVLDALTTDWRVVVALQDASTLSPTPDVILPAFALVAEIKPDNDAFAQRLRVAFQSFVGLANLGGAQTKSPPLELLSETHEGVALSTTRFMPAANAPDDAEKSPVHLRHNFSPTAAMVGRHFVLSSSLGLAKGLVTHLMTGATADSEDEEGTFVAQADGAALAKLVEINRPRLVMQNVLEKGNDEARAGTEVDLLAALLRYLGDARLGVTDGEPLWRLNLDFKLGK